MHNDCILRILYVKVILEYDKFTFHVLVHSFNHAKKQRQRWRMMIFPEEIRSSVFKQRLVISPLATIEHPVFISMMFIQEFCDLFKICEL